VTLSSVCIFHCHDSLHPTSEEACSQIVSVYGQTCTNVPFGSDIVSVYGQTCTKLPFDSDIVSVYGQTCTKVAFDSDLDICVE
jgi:hypothetical protein